MTPRKSQGKETVDENFKRYEALRLVTFSCHEAALRQLRERLRSHEEIKASHLYEFLLKKPIVRRATKAGDEDPCFVPFLDREVAARGYLIDSQKLKQKDRKRQRKEICELIVKMISGEGPVALPSVPTSGKEEYRVVSELRDLGTITGRPGSKMLLREWKETGDRSKKDTALYGPCHMYSLIQRPSEIRTSLLMALSAGVTAEEKLAFMNVFGPLALPLLFPGARGALHHIVVPIASCEQFFGVLALILELGPSAPVSIAYQRSLERRNMLGAALEKVAEELFVPTLLLNQQSQLESALRGPLETGEAKKVTAVLAEIEVAIPLRCKEIESRKLSSLANDDSRTLARQNMLLEQTFARIWDCRIKILQCQNLDESAFQMMSRRLIFAKMKVASRGMLGTVHDTIRAASQVGKRKRDSDPLPCVLVVGGAGSGKENIAKLVALLAEGFENAEVIVENVAGKRDAKEVCTKLTELEERVKKEEAKPLGLVWDELNSLSVDVQGALLRVLEQGELISGAPIQSKVPVVVVGIVNEDPGQLTLSAVRGKTKDTVVFGEMLGSVLYEHFKTKSRMRDDLYFRMRRCGEVRIADLDQRREDIPAILRYKYDEVGGGVVDDRRVFFTYGALKTLTDPRLSWPGNVRQLELVAREVRSAVTRVLSGDGAIGEPAAVIVDEWMIGESLRRAKIGGAETL